MADDIRRVSKIMFICAMCDHGIDAKNRSPRGEYVGCGHEQCAGPSKGGTYEEYAGVLKGVQHQYCYVCGGEPTGVVKVRDKFFGICETHKSHLRTQVHRAGGKVTEKFLKKGKNFERLESVG